jgi:hypothetical protein
MQAFVVGALAEAELEAITTHLDDCAACRATLGAVTPLRDDAQASDRIGRYLLRRALGAGGMGVVYEAFDPELDRIVAVKLLHGALGTHAQQARLVSEAQAMAKLSHANVVAVYDIGRERDRVYIVMELVDGTSLRHRLAEGNLPLPRVLDWFAQAAAGLQAAHAAGLVHRDFKPENVLIARDGVARVSDFGLACLHEEEIDQRAIAQEGSPAYMAPEQRTGQSLDARSDQYSYCVAFREVIASTGASPPGWLSALLARGQGERPEARFPSMAALLEALRRGQRRARTARYALLGAALAVVCGAAMFWVGGRRQQAAQRCSGGGALLATVWNADISARVGKAFARSESPLQADAWRVTQRTVAEYAASFQQAHQNACEATRVRGEQSEALLDEKMACLGERLRLLGAVAAQLENVDAPMMERVPQVLQVLRPIAECAELSAHGAWEPPPAEAERARVEGVRQTLARAAAAIGAGRYREGLTLAQAAQAATQGLRYLPVRAEADLWAGVAHGRSGDDKTAESELERAASSASASQAGLLAARAWIQLMHFVGIDEQRYDDGARYNDYADNALRAMNGVDELEVERLGWWSALLTAKQRYAEAGDVSRQALARVEQRLGPNHASCAPPLDGIAASLAALGKSRDALIPQERACDLLRAALGEQHPQRALCLNNLAALHANLGEHEPAIALKQQALAIFTAVPGHPSHIAMLHRNLARSLLELGRLDEANAQLEQGGTSASDQIAILRLRGEWFRRHGKLAEALTVHRDAVTRTRDSDGAQQIGPLTDLAETELFAHHVADAAAHARQAVQRSDAAYGPSSYRLAEPLRVWAEAELAQGRAVEARAPAERAVSVLAAAQVDPLLRARVLFCLARALASDATAKPRALALVAEARALAESTRRDPPLQKALARWPAPTEN